MNSYNGNAARKSDKPGSGFGGIFYRKGTTRRKVFLPANPFYRFCAWILDSFLFCLFQGFLFFAIIAFGVVLLSLDLNAFMDVIDNFQHSRYSLNFTTLSVSDIVGNSGLTLLGMGFYCLYFTLFERYCGGMTPGKFLLGLRVLNGSDETVTFFEALARNVYKFTPLGICLFGLTLSMILLQTLAMVLVPTILMASFLVSLVVAVWTYLNIFVCPHNQALYDKWSYCYVVADPDYDNNLRLAFAFLTIAILSLSLAINLKGRAQTERRNIGSALVYDEEFRPQKVEAGASAIPRLSLITFQE